MATVREHLRALHETTARHHERLSKLHRSMMESQEDNSPEYEMHKGLAEAHSDAAADHLECCKSLDAANHSDEGFHIGAAFRNAAEVNDLRKDSTAKAAGINFNPTAGLRMVPRAGAPSADGMTKVASGCESFVEVDF